jgi:MHS family proline/betaine transporter-like MFS transporter
MFLALRANRTLLNLCLGNLVELYDFATFGASAALLALVVTAGQGGLTAVFVVLAAALLLRPVGAVVVGRISDRRGRRVPFLVMTLLTCATTVAVGLLPSAATAGLFAALGLAALRCLQAFCTGGQTSTSVAFVFESAGRGQRGVYGGFHLASSAIGMGLGTGGVLLVSVLLTPAQIVAWGWRLPFLAALPLALAVLALRSRLRESSEFLPTPPAPGTGTTRRSGPTGAVAVLPQSSVALLARRRPRAVVAGVLLGAAFGVTVNLWFVYAPAHLLTTGRATAGTALGPACVGLLACAALAPFAGRLSDRLGRRPVLVGACVALALLWPVTFVGVLTGDGGAGFAVASVAVGAALSGFVLASYLPEAFAVGDRAAGVGLTFGVGSGIFGGLAPLLAGWLAGTDRTTAIALYPASCAALAAVAVVWSAREPDVDGLAASPGQSRQGAQPLG